MPVVGLSSTRSENTIQVDPGVANEFRLSVVVKDRYLETVIIWRVMDGEAEFLVPADVSNVVQAGIPKARYSPPRRLSTSLVCFCFLRLLTQASGTIRVLFAHSPFVWQVSGAIHDDNESANHRSVYGHVGKDARGVGAAKGSDIDCFGSHGCLNSSSFSPGDGGRSRAAGWAKVEIVMKIRGRSERLRSRVCSEDEYSRIR